MKKFNVLSRQNRLILSICLAFLFVITYDIGKIGYPANLSGKYGFPRNTELYSTEKKIESERLNKLLDLNRIAIIAVREDTAFVYDPEKYVLSHSFYPVSNGQSCYLSESDYQNKTKKSIKVTGISSEPMTEFQQIQNDELFNDGIRKIENLMETGIPEDSDIYLFSSSLTRPEPDVQQVKLADEVLMENNLTKKNYKIFIPSLADVLINAVTHLQTLLVSAAGIAFAGCMMFELLLCSRSCSSSQRALFFHFLTVGTACGLLELLILSLRGYGLLSLTYSLDSVLFIWGSFMFLWLIFALLFRILTKFSVASQSKILSLIKGTGLGGVITVDSILLSVLIRSLASGPGPDTLFILFCLILPLFVSYILFIQTSAAKNQTGTALNKECVLNTACSLILILLAAFIGMSFVPWTAAVIAILLLIPAFRTHPEGHLTTS